MIECSDLVETARATQTGLRAVRIIARKIMWHSKKIAEYVLACFALVKEETTHLEQTFGSTKNMMSVNKRVKSATFDLSWATEALRKQIFVELRGRS